MNTKEEKIYGLFHSEWDGIAGLLFMISASGARRAEDIFPVQEHLPPSVPLFEALERFCLYAGGSSGNSTDNEDHFQYAWILAALYASQCDAPEYFLSWEIPLIVALLRHEMAHFERAGTPLCTDLARLLCQGADALAGHTTIPTFPQ